MIYLRVKYIKMNDVKTFFLMSLSVSVGLLFYTIFVYLGYLIFFAPSEEKENSQTSEIKEKEKIDSFDILEDVE